MQIVLLERIAKLGQMGEVVTVKDGYARNFLLPAGKAMRANKANLAQFEGQRVQLEAQNLDRKTDAEAVKVKMDGHEIVIIRQSGETGQLYGSVNTRDIAGGLTETGFETNKNQVTLETPIKTLGVYSIRITLHPEVESIIKVNVARTVDEAERQARGENIIDSDRDEASFIEETVFEDGDGEMEARAEVSEDFAEAAEAETAEEASEETAEEAS
jgi:large subunit ribosomal protein L9